MKTKSCNVKKRKKERKKEEKRKDASTKRKIIGRYGRKRKREERSYWIRRLIH